MFRGMGDIDQHPPRAVRQIRDLVAWIGDGRKLTQTGRLTLGDARILVDKLDTGDQIDPVIGNRVFKTPTSAELIGLTRIVEWAKTASLLRTVKGRLVPVKKHQKLLTDTAALRSRLFDALAGYNFAVDTGYGFQTLVVVDYRLAFDTIAAILYVHQRDKLSVPKIAEAVWDTLAPRWRTSDLTELQLRSWRSANDSDVRDLLECLAAIDAVALEGNTVELTASGRTELARHRGEPTPGQEVWRLRIELLEVDNPAVWRRIDLVPSTTLARLHETIQAAMGWENYHLHAFRTADGTEYGPTGTELEFRDETTTTIADILAPGHEVVYTYDFGDDWHHRITLELTTIAQEGRAYPHCFDGAGACPAEDAGGPPGWANVKAAIADPTDDEHTDYLTWLGLTSPDQFDPAAFDLGLANKRLRAIV
jgi:uncharacterized protein YndB with AHSA1/START domain